MSSRADTLTRWLDDALGDLPRDSAILAVGCEEAFLATHLLNYAADVTVLDTSGGQLAQLARRFPEISFLSHRPTQALPFPPKSFDVVCCSQFLDRVFDPAAALREIGRVLAPGGRLLVSVADHGAMRKVWGVLFRQEEERIPAHPRVHTFTRRSLTGALREAGFAGIRTATVAARGDAMPEHAPRLVAIAQKPPELQRLVTPAQDRGRNLVGILQGEELAFAGRARAA